MTDHAHEHRLPESAEEWADAWASTFGQEYCTRCLAALSGVISITGALEASTGLPSLRSMLLGVRREFGPWAAVALCFGCGDVAVWLITLEDRRALADALAEYVG